jgi:hypothetical protein
MVSRLIERHTGRSRRFSLIPCSDIGIRANRKSESLHVQGNPVAVDIEDLEREEIYVWSYRALTK